MFLDVGSCLRKQKHKHMARLLQLHGGNIAQENQLPCVFQCFPYRSIGGAARPPWKTGHLGANRGQSGPVGLIKLLERSTWSTQAAQATKRRYSPSAIWFLNTSAHAGYTPGEEAPRIRFTAACTSAAGSRPAAVVLASGLFCLIIKLAIKAPLFHYLTHYQLRQLYFESPVDQNGAFVRRERSADPLLLTFSLSVSSPPPHPLSCASGAHYILDYSLYLIFYTVSHHWNKLSTHSRTDG